MPGEVTRFAPSPTGLLHLGHAYSAFDAADAAAGGRFLLRIEDIDRTRCKPEFAAAIEQDLAWLGLDWERPVRRQSEHLADYQTALSDLDAMGLLYPCVLSRKELAAAFGPDSDDLTVVTDTDRVLDPELYAERLASGQPRALRLRMARAIARTGPLTWTDDRHGVRTARPERHGDVVLARKETPTSYHLSVTVDDALQGITLVTRGMDLFESTDVHRLLQALLGLPTPRYRHHDLLVDGTGTRLAKSHNSPSLRSLRDGGATPEAIRRKLGWAA
ncbi:MAG: tRNA glutamyl-Q(34) synthetase GluQRS [Alphaproteobacteria bacterium]|nr:tRNA glutamyl-Q(34) synthetase GluQRS [Alphaproteobacteria bacterium]